jgi:predicted ribonuclease YlaK
MSQLFLFLDCNILLHYEFFTDLDWLTIAKVNSVELVLPSNVISTLDQKKFESSDSAVKDRARRVIARLDKTINQDPPDVRNNVTLCLLDQGAEIDYVKLNLNPCSEDDRILAEILNYRQISRSGHCCYHWDFGFRLKLTNRGIPILRLSDDYLLGDRLNSDQKRIKELEAKILKLERMQPKLNLTFSSGKNFIEVEMRSPRLLSDEQILSQVANKRDLLTRSFSMDIIEKRAMEIYLDEYQSFLKKKKRA